MRYIIPLAFALICVFYIASATEYKNSLQKAVENYNKNLDKSPDSIKSLLGNEKVSIAISLNNGGLLKWGFETKNARIMSYAHEDLKNPTIEVYATENAINDVLNSPDFEESYQREEKAGNIRIDGKTLDSILRLRMASINTNDLKYFLSMVKP